MSVPQGVQYDYISRVREGCTELSKAYDGLRSLYRLWQTTMNTIIDDDDFVGENEGLVAADLIAALGSLFANTEDTLADWMATHAGNIDRMRY